MLDFNSILIFSENPKVLSDFYKRVFQKESDMEQSDYTGFLVGKTFINIGPHDKVKGKNLDPNRIIINFETSDVKGEFDRIKNLGVKVIADPYSMNDMAGMQIATFEDPDGNYFQLISPWKNAM
jgi:predicted enzyme related to lactoylglutathione lyase